MELKLICFALHNLPEWPTTAAAVNPNYTLGAEGIGLRLYEASRQAHVDSETRERPSYCTICTLCAQTVWAKLASSPSVGITCVAQAIRHAQSLVS